MKGSRRSEPGEAFVPAIEAKMVGVGREGSIGVVLLPDMIAGDGYGVRGLSSSS